MNIAVLLSGGVDSSVVVHLLCEQGYRPSLFYIKIGRDDADYMDCSAEEDMEEKEAAQDEEQDEVSTGSEDVTEQAEAPEAETAAAAEPSEEFTDSEEIEAAEGSEEASDEPSEEQDEFSGQEADEIPLASGVENLSSGSMKLQAQEQQDKEEEETYQEIGRASCRERVSNYV